jgi:hypothetical protein
MADDRYRRDREGDYPERRGSWSRAEEPSPGREGRFAEGRRNGGEVMQEGWQGRGTYGEEHGPGQSSGWGASEPYGGRQSGGEYGGRSGGEPYGGRQGSWGGGEFGGRSGGEPYGGRQGSWGGGQSEGFAGRGPKGYRRSDERIQEELSEALTRDRDIDASEIEITVHGGEVTLKGTVDSRQTKRQVEDLAESMSGVRQCRNELRVRSGSEADSTLASHQSTTASTAGGRGREAETRSSKT